MAEDEDKKNKSKAEKETEAPKPAEASDKSTDASKASDASSSSDSATDQTPPPDALSRTPEDLEKERKEKGVADPEPVKQPSKLRRFFRRINVYLLFFLLVFAIGAVITVVTYLNSKKQPPEPTVASQKLDQDALKQLSSSDVSVGSKSQTLTIKGDTEIQGQTLMRSDLNVAGDIQASGNLTVTDITSTGKTNLKATQAQSLQVANNVAIKGDTTMQALNVSGASTFSGPITASKLTVTDIVLSGNAKLEVPNHISFTGPTPHRSVDSTGLGSGGSASVKGSDTAGTININTGTNTKAGCFIRVNFRKSFPKAPYVIISPVGSAAGKVDFYTKRDANGFNVCASSASPINKSFSFDYLVTY